MNKLEKKIIKIEFFFLFKIIRLIPYNTQGIQAAACKAFGNLINSVTFKLHAINNADIKATK